MDSYDESEIIYVFTDDRGRLIIGDHPHGSSVDAELHYLQHHLPTFMDDMMRVTVTAGGLHIYDDKKIIATCVSAAINPTQPVVHYKRAAALVYVLTKVYLLWPMYVGKTQAIILDRRSGAWTLDVVYTKQSSR